MITHPVMICLLGIFNGHAAESGLKYGNHEHAQKRADGVAAAAHQAGSADHAGGDGGKLDADSHAGIRGFH